MKNCIFKSMLIALVALFSLSANAYDVEIDGIYYNIVAKSKVATVTHIGDEYNANYYAPPYRDQVNIPAFFEYDGVTYSVKAIGEYAFWYCTSLTSVTIPSSVVSIGYDAFGFCSSLASVTISNGVTSIGPYAFHYCTSLTSITLPNSVTSIDYSAFTYSGLTSIIIPSSVTSIGSSVFYNCRSLTSITLSSSVTSIGSNVFTGCWSLTSIIIPNSVTSIGSGAFEDCQSLTFITIPNTVTSIGSEAFKGCSSLMSVTIGSAIRNLEKDAFTSCGELLDVYCAAETPPSMMDPNNGNKVDVFKDSYIEYATLHVPKNSIYAYQSADEWKDFGNIVAIENEEESSDVELVEGVEMYYNETERSCNSITYTRNFNNTNWQALYVPFSMSYNDWKDDFDVARINAFYEYDTDNDGIVDKQVLEILPVKDGNGDLRPNYPYMIKAKTIGEKTITLTDATLYKTEENSIECSTVETKYTFTGTYHKMNGLKSAGYYFMSGGGLKTAPSDDTNLGAFRWYLKAENKGSALIQPIAEIKIRVLVDDEERVTGIEEVEMTQPTEKKVYSIDGRLVSTNGTEGLKPGIYIVNGKKVTVQ